MYTAQPKKLLILQILDILRKHSDENHRLSQKEIAGLLEKEYGVTAERKAVKRNLMDLIEYGYPIEYDEIKRSTANRVTGEADDTSKLSGFYLAHDFSESELRLLIDGLLFSKHIPYSQCRELVEKLEGLSNTYFRSRVRHIRTMPDTMPPNKQLFYTIEVLDDAISQMKQAAFCYNSYGVDKKLHPRLNEDGSVKEYIVSPYQIAAANGRYYLICNTQPHDNVSHYRLDRITDIRLLDTAMRPAKTVQGLEHGFDLPKHMAEHLYMFSGESRPVRFRAKKSILNDVIDWFGTDIRFSDESSDEVTASVSVNLKAMRLWAIQYGPYVKVLSPQSLAEEVKQDMQQALSQY